LVAVVNGALVRWFGLSALIAIAMIYLRPCPRRVDGVLVSRGFHRDLHPLAAEDQARGIIAFYGICGVSLRENRLTVGFLEIHAQRSSAHVRKTCNLLKHKLSSRYGADRVKIEH
jgi:hypothetical protein